MTTPDPDRKSSPFEWRALTINKVEKIQLERLHKEQHRIEKELREQDALEREARELETREHEREALEQAWFDEGQVQQRDTLQDANIPKDAAALAPLSRLSSSLASVLQSLKNPRLEPRSSVPPPPLNESPVSITLILAACAFGGSVYLSLRWVADVRQAHVTQELSSSVNATATAVNLGTSSLGLNPAVRADSPLAASAPSVTSNNYTIALSTTVAPATANPTLQVAPVAGTTPTVSKSSPVGMASLPRVAVAPPISAAGSTRPSGGANTRRSFVSAGGASPAQATFPTAAQVDVESELNAASPASATTPTAKSRVLVPAAGSPHAAGTRVYRGGE